MPPKAKTKKTKTAVAKKQEPKRTLKYYEAVGRRKTAFARVRIFSNQEPKFVVNGKDVKQYFPTANLQETALASLAQTDSQKTLGVKVLVRGGGINAQAEAVRLGLARVLVKFSPEIYKNLRALGYLTRDPRMRERKKFGLKRARRAPQWQKR